MLFSSPGTRCAIALAVIVYAFVVVATPNPTHAIGWDSDDFLIGGGPSFTNKIGVFDHDLTFKGLLDSNFVTVAGMDFDAAGHLVAVASGSVRSIRVYESSGAIVGGFTRNDDLLGTSNDLKVAPNGDSVIATQNFGGGDRGAPVCLRWDICPAIREWQSHGRRALPGSVAWIGGIGTGPISVFDLTSGVQTGTISVATVNSMNSMTYSGTTNSVLIATIGNRVVETDVNGNLIRTFTAPSNIGISAVTRGFNGDVFATAGDQSILRWHADGQFAGAVSTASVLGGAGGIVWAGAVPEPNLGMICSVAVFLLYRRVGY